MRPEKFLARLVALIPLPSFPLVRNHGVFAPDAPWRGAIVPEPRRVHHRDRGRPRASVARCEAAAAVGRSGDSKLADHAATQVVLPAFGERVREARSAPLLRRCERPWRGPRFTS